MQIRSLFRLYLAIVALALYTELIYFLFRRRRRKRTRRTRRGRGDSPAVLVKM